MEWYCHNRWYRIVSAGIVGGSKARSTVGKLEEGLDAIFSDFSLFF